MTSNIEELAVLWAKRLDGDETISENVENQVVEMNFFQPPNIQWNFILQVMALTQSESGLGKIAAGPVEHLLGFHGEEYISLIEQQAQQSEKFKKMLKLCWRHRMSDDVWERLQKARE
jgi:hypothetical protein